MATVDSSPASSESLIGRMKKPFLVASGLFALSFVTLYSKEIANRAERAINALLEKNTPLSPKDREKSFQVTFRQLCEELDTQGEPVGTIQTSLSAQKALSVERYQKALEFVQKVKEPNGKYSRVTTLIMAEAMIGLGQEKEAEDLFLQAKEMQEAGATNCTFYANHDLCLLYMKQGRVSEAIALYEKEILTDPGGFAGFKQEHDGYSRQATDSNENVRANALKRLFGIERHRWTIAEVDRLMRQYHQKDQFTLARID